MSLSNNVKGGLPFVEPIDCKMDREFWAGVKVLVVVLES